MPPSGFLIVGLALVEDALLAVELELLHVLAQLDHHLGLAEGADDAVHVQRLAPDSLQGQVLAHVGVFVRGGLAAQRAQFLPIGEQGDQPLPRQRLHRDLEQVLGGRVGVANEAAGIHHQHGRGQQVEAGEAVVRGW
jgi:hypothetical protein